MTKNKTAICTPTKTRADFESILRELDGVGVKWSNGEKPSDIGWKKEKRYLAYRSDGIRWGVVPVGEQLPRAEFTSAIKRDFARECEHEWRFNCCIKCGVDDVVVTGNRNKPKEQPKMNYNKMLKDDLIAALRKRDAAIKSMNAHGEQLDKDLASQTEKTRSALQSLKMANVWVDKYNALKKTNAEQAETIESLESSIKCLHIETADMNNNLAGERRALKKITAKLEKQTASISKFVTDVLEGK